MSDENNDVVFLKVHVDDSEDLAAEYDVTAMPTFIFFKNGKKRETLIGADEKKLKEGVMTWK